jgi:uncharacterized protein YfaS (alpha-2-macroglobulin family)
MNVNNNLTIAGGNIKLLEKKVGLEEFKPSIPKGSEDNWIAFEFTKDLTPNTRYTVNFPKGTPSAEGPLVTISDQQVGFNTYPPFTVQSHYPDDSQRWSRKANPGQEWTFSTSNEIKTDVLRKELFEIKPSIPFTIAAKRHSLTIYPQSTQNKSYTVTLNRTMIDVHGQALTGKNDYTFQTGPDVKPDGNLQGPNGILTMDPIQSPIYYPIQITNYDELDISIYHVTPYTSRIMEHQVWHQSTLSNSSKQRSWFPDKSRVFHEKKKFEQVARDEPFEYHVDISKYLQDVKQQLGQVVVVAYPTDAAINKTSNTNLDYRPMAAAWLQCTRLSLDPFRDTRTDNPGIIAWVNDLSTGRPIAGATVTHHSASDTGPGVQTDAQGLAHLKPYNDSTGRGVPLIARLGNDCVFLPQYHVFPHHINDFAWFTFDDRQLYKPKEEVCVKGYVRKLERKGEARLPTYVTGDIDYVVKDPRGQELLKGTTKLTAFGTFDFKFILKDNVNLGQGSIEFTSKTIPTPYGAAHSHYFKIQEYRRPEFKASANHRPSAGVNHVTSTGGGIVVAEALATYFAGGPLSDASVKWTVTPTRGSYAPPGHTKFAFGKSIRFLFPSSFTCRNRPISVNYREIQAMVAL